MSRATSPAAERGRPSVAPLLLDLFTSALLGLGLVFAAAPAVFLWLIHGSGERYLWLISGPAPFDQWGSGPYQLGVCVMLTFIACCCLATAVVVRRAQMEDERPRPRTLAALGAGTAGVTISFSTALAIVVTALFG